MKKYNIVWKLWTGNWYLDGRREYGDELKVRTNNINYIFLARDKYFSEMDIYTGKVDLYDLQTQKPLSYNDLLNS